jgi:hypothetical protein
VKACLYCAAACAAAHLQVYALRQLLQAAGLPVQRRGSIKLDEVLHDGGQLRRSSSSTCSDSEGAQQEQQGHVVPGPPAAGAPAAGGKAAPDEAAAGATLADSSRCGEEDAVGACAGSNAASITSATLQRPEDSALGHGRGAALAFRSCVYQVTVHCEMHADLGSRSFDAWCQVSP